MVKKLEQIAGFLLALSLSASFLPMASSELVEFTDGHGDIGLAYEAVGGLFLHYHFGSGAVLDDVMVPPFPPEGVELDPIEAYVRVADSTLTIAPSAISFLGLNAGDPVWTLPQGSSSGIPFLGLAAEELSPVQFNSAGFRLTGFRGPVGGHFGLFQIPAFAAPVVYMRTNDGINPAADFFLLAIEGHDHANFAFTKAGLYELDIEGFASGPAGSFTDMGRLLFAVGSTTVVPEPTSSALILVSAAGLAIGQRRRSQVGGRSAGS